MMMIQLALMMAILKSAVAGARRNIKDTERRMIDVIRKGRNMVIVTKRNAIVNIIIRITRRNIHPNNHHSKIREPKELIRPL